MLSVLGFPRTGFTLLISIIIELRNLHGNQTKKHIIADRFQRMEHFQNTVPKKIETFLGKNKLSKSLIFNANFHHPLGGPNWIDEDRKTLCVRKYVGVKGLGDATFIISLPLEFILHHEIPHSHGPLKPWREQYPDATIFHSVRAAAGTINSAVHSINALTSEYLQRWYTNIDEYEEDLIRKGLALAKLSDLNFFQAMVEPMHKSYAELANNKDNVKLFHWESILSNPTQTILRISQELNLDTSYDAAEAIWAKIGFKNLTQSHKHNYRSLGKKLTGHYSSLVNEHIEILRNKDFLALSKQLQLEPPSFIDERNYTDFQKILDSNIRKGNVIQYTKDVELYWLSFQKTNIDFTKFDFKVFGWKKHTKLERTNIDDEQITNHLWDIFEQETATLLSTK